MQASALIAIRYWSLFGQVNQEQSLNTVTFDQTLLTAKRFY